MVKNTNRVGMAIAMILRALLNTKAWSMFSMLITKGSAPMESITVISWGEQLLIRQLHTHYPMQEHRFFKS